MDLSFSQTPSRSTKAFCQSPVAGFFASRLHGRPGWQLEAVPRKLAPLVPFSSFNQRKGCLPWLRIPGVLPKNFLGPTVISTKNAIWRGCRSATGWDFVLGPAQIFNIFDVFLVANSTLGKSERAIWAIFIHGWMQKYLLPIGEPKELALFPICFEGAHLLESV